VILGVSSFQDSEGYEKSFREYPKANHNLREINIQISSFFRLRSLAILWNIAEYLS